MRTRKSGVMDCWSVGVPGRIRASLVPLLSLVLAFPVFAAHQAADDASASVYDTGWVGGANGGYGFGVWTNIQEDNGGWAGFFVANSVANPSLGGIASGPSNRAWATYANGPNFNQAVAFRELTDGVLVSGQTFTVYFENGDVAAGGSCGFCLRTGFVAGVCDDYNVGRQFEFGFMGGSSTYFIVDGTSGGDQFDTGVGWTTNGLKIALTMTSAVNYSLEVVVLDVKATSRFSRALAGSGGIRSVALYNRNTDVGGEAGDVYFNLVSVTGDPASPYALVPSAQDGGGRRITNASLQVVDASVGGPFGLLTNAQVHVLKSGYPAQLYEFAGLQAYASPPTVPEANTRQLGARWIYDDWTGYAVDGTPNWSIAGGPLASISGGGLALASNVYQDTAAGARAVFGGYTDVVSLVVVNTNWDDYYAYADDEVDDAWQVDQFGENDPNALGDEDPDTDGRNNRMEWITGTLPEDDTSFFAAWGRRIQNVSTQIDIYYHPSFVDRNYEVLRVSNLTGMVWGAVSEYSLSESGGTSTVRDLNIPTDQMYYRVKVTRP